MKTSSHILLTFGILLLCACNATADKKRYSPIEEQHVAHELLAKANKVGTDDNEHRMMLFDKAIYHFANIVVRSDANDTLRADALFTLRWIEAYVKHDYEQALQYLNQYLELVGPNHESFPTCLAYKAVYLCMSDFPKYYYLPFPGSICFPYPLLEFEHYRACAVYKGNIALCGQSVGCWGLSMGTDKYGGV